jgi:hypothetical protein
MIYGPGYTSIFYEGSYKEDLKDGFGMLTSKEGVYKGHFINDKFNGHGTFETKAGVILTGMFRDNKLILKE